MIVMTFEIRDANHAETVRCLFPSAVYDEIETDIVERDGNLFLIVAIGDNVKESVRSA